VTDSLLPQTKGMLRRLDLKARKRLGQHFLVDGEVLQKVVAAADLTATDTVIEVGPGLGVLTKELAQKTGRVVAVELDDRLAAVLRRETAALSNVTVVNKDILKIEPSGLLGGQVAGYKVVANLPYYITSAVLRHFLEASLKPRLMVIMLQKEVAQAVAAGAGKMSLLSVSVRFYGMPEIVCYVPAASFYPPPEVDSAILKIEVYDRPALDIEDINGFFALVRAGFCARRKQLANSLAQGLELPREEALSLLERADIINKRRAETLSIEEWGRLWWAFGEKRNDNA